MASLKDYALLTLSLLLLAAPAVSSHKVVPMPFQKRALTNTLMKRSTVAATINNYLPLGEYFATVSVGTPGQDLELVIDTGSSDVWFFGPNACNVEASGGACEGGSYDSSKSSTYVLIAEGDFQIQYETAGSGVVGDYISDNFGIGGITLTNLTMAVATQANQTQTGIMGIALDVDESYAQESGEKEIYNNLPDELLIQGKISSKSYSLYLDNLASGSGQVLFGGYDTAKFTGDLIMLPLQEDSESGIVDSFAIAWTSLAITSTANGSYSILSTDLPAAAIMDSGTTLTYLPQDIFETVANALDVSYDRDNGYTISCDIGTTNPGTLNYGFGGANGPRIAVPFQELAIPLYSYTTGVLETGICSFGIMPNDASNPILFGQTFLRSAYALYDLEKLFVGLAPTVYDTTASNIVEYKPGSSNPSVTTDSTGPTITVASIVDNPGIGYSSYYFSSSVNLGGTVTAVTTTDLPATRSYPTEAFATSLAASLTPQGEAASGTGSGSSSSSSSSSSSPSSLATAGSVPRVGTAIFLGVLGTVGMMLLGGLLLV